MLTPRVDGVLSFNRTRDAKNKKEEKKKKEGKIQPFERKKKRYIDGKEVIQSGFVCIDLAKRS